MRLTSDFWVAAIMRRIRAEGGFAYLTRRGASEAGTIFIQIRHKNGMIDLYGPAPQSYYDESHNSDERLFIAVLTNVTEDQSIAKLEKELKFDADLWLVEIEDYEVETLPFSIMPQ